MDEEDENIFYFEIKGDEGDFHCLTCSKICNYLDDKYCCRETRNMSMQTKLATSAFFMMCACRHFINMVAKALIQGKHFEHPDKSCALCRFKNKVHDSPYAWCTNQAQSYLFHLATKEAEDKSYKYLEKYCNLRKVQRMNEIDTALEKVTKTFFEYHDEHDQFPTEEEKEHACQRQYRRNRHSRRRTEMSVDDLNDECFERMTKAWSKRRQEIVKELEISGKEMNGITMEYHFRREYERRVENRKAMEAVQKARKSVELKPE